MGMSRTLMLFFFLGMLGIAYLDYATGKEIAVWALYLVPVGVAAWMAGPRAGFALAAASCALMFATGVLFGDAYSGFWFFLLALGNRAIALFAVAWLASRLFREQMLESTLHSYEACMDYYHVSPDKDADCASPETGDSRARCDCGN